MLHNVLHKLMSTLVLRQRRCRHAHLGTVPCVSRFLRGSTVSCIGSRLRASILSARAARHDYTLHTPRRRKLVSIDKHGKAKYVKQCDVQLRHFAVQPSHVQHSHVQPATAPTAQPTPFKKQSHTPRRQTTLQETLHKRHKANTKPLRKLITKTKTWHTQNLGLKIAKRSKTCVKGAIVKHADTSDIFGMSVRVINGKPIGSLTIKQIADELRSAQRPVKVVFTKIVKQSQ